MIRHETRLPGLHEVLPAAADATAAEPEGLVGELGAEATEAGLGGVAAESASELLAALFVLQVGPYTLPNPYEIKF